MSVFAAEATPQEPAPAIDAEPFMARIDGEDMLVAADGIVMLYIDGFDEPIGVEIPRYIYIDGERIPIDDDKIEGITPIVSSLVPFGADSRALTEEAPTINFIVSLSGALPSNPVVSEAGQEWTHPAYVTMNGRVISSRRYLVLINGVSYEAFCADPNMPGPGEPNAVYELTGIDGSQFRTVLRYGFPTNPALTVGLTSDDRAWNSYMTRVAVAYISRPNATWGRLTGSTRVAVDNRISGAGGAAAKANSPAIIVNGEMDTSDRGDIPQSSPFVVGNTRRTNCHRNPFRFEWAQGTPAGTRLYVDNVFVVTAPANSTDVFSYVSGGGFRNISDFHFVMPDGSEGQTARVNLVGINNQYAGRVFVMQNPNNPTGWQDIIFYMPMALASAAYTWEYDADYDGRLRITKLSAYNGSTLAGATFRITGPNGFNVTRTTSANGVIELLNLRPGFYTIMEVSPPPGYRLSSPATQTVTIVEGSDEWVTVDFQNDRRENGNGNGGGSTAPRPSVRIQKICALGRYNIPDALIRIEGRSAFNVVSGDGQLWSINNTGVDISVVLTAGHTLPVVPDPTPDDPYPMWFELEDGVLTIHNIPFGYFRVQEERAPDGYSLLPQHTAYSFWVLPPDVFVGGGNGGGGNIDGDDDWDWGDYVPDIPLMIDDDAGTPEFFFDEEQNVNSILVTFENFVRP